MASYVTLRYPRRYGTLGMIFEKGIRTQVSDATARELQGDDRFNVELMADGVPSVSVGTDSQEAEGGRPTNKNTRIQMILEAIDELDADNDSHWTAAGKPDARALTSVLGWQVTSSERDDALRAQHLAQSNRNATQTAETPVSRKGNVTITRKPKEDVAQVHRNVGDEGQEVETSPAPVIAAPTETPTTPDPTTEDAEEIG